MIILGVAFDSTILVSIKVTLSNNRPRTLILYTMIFLIGYNYGINNN